MIQIELKLFVTLSKHLPDSADAYPIDDGTTIQTLIDTLKMDDAQVKLIFVNGVKEDRTYQLRDGDRVGLFPPVGGG